MSGPTVPQEALMKPLQAQFLRRTAAFPLPRALSKHHQTKSGGPLAL
ncbi:hypothetical protein NBRC3257_1323 [Gluconobacter thailandicus NBRC 3257]|uniref:Uncharacterized protein n=1 Tax=Gluconobacter thailandicus NBRC 3257 TaxID=1381097 RepID=A0ABQ0IVV1_GLUTH|nr:hypothetical protein NBRC3257_1323 [Gluconobacter thailandicus NBRC 3257]